MLIPTLHRGLLWKLEIENWKLKITKRSLVYPPHLVVIRIITKTTKATATCSQTTLFFNFSSKSNLESPSKTYIIVAKASAPFIGAIGQKERVSITCAETKVKITA